MNTFPTRREIFDALGINVRRRYGYEGLRNAIGIRLQYADLPHDVARRVDDANYGIAYAIQTGRINAEAEAAVRSLTPARYADLVVDMARERVAIADAAAYLHRRFC